MIKFKETNEKKRRHESYWYLLGILKPRGCRRPSSVLMLKLSHVTLASKIEGREVWRQMVGRKSLVGSHATSICGTARVPCAPLPWCAIRRVPPAIAILSFCHLAMWLPFACSDSYLKPWKTVSTQFHGRKRTIQSSD